MTPFVPSINLLYPTLSFIPSKIPLPNLAAAKFIKSELVNLIYPVGAIYISTSNTTPATLFGGTWQQIKDKFLLSAGDTYSAGSTGGDATHTHTAGTITAKVSVHTANEMDAQFGTAESWWAATNTVGISSYSAQTRTHGDAISCAGTTGSTSSLPPYLTVYMWKRTA